MRTAARTVSIATLLIILCLMITPLVLGLGLIVGIVEGVKSTINLWILMANTIRGTTEDPPSCP